MRLPTAATSASRSCNEGNATDQTGIRSRKAHRQVLHTIDDARECVEAAEALLNRAQFGCLCNPRRRDALWRAFERRVDSAVSILAELKGESGRHSRRYGAKSARIAFTAASRPWYAANFFIRARTGPEMWRMRPMYWPVTRLHQLRPRKLRE